MNTPISRKDPIVEPSFFAFLSLILSTGTANPATAIEDGNRPGILLHIDLMALGGNAYEAEIGDIVQCHINYAVVSQPIVSDLEITIQKKPLALVAGQTPRSQNFWAPAR